MGFFDNLFSKKIQPEDLYLVTITDEQVKVEHPKRKTEVLFWDDLHTILLINTSLGPWQPDVWLTLVGDNGGCMIPQGAKGYEEVYDIVSQRDGFNFENVILSMSCTDDKEFLLWTNKQ
ncbi:MAG: hypothetical protein M3O71_06195 [Bacteroidota bacterium]|nr:hypothetical protein [Bacteroidota bacterium]